MKRVLIVTAVVLSLAACKKPADAPEAAAPNQTASASAAANSAIADTSGAVSAPGATPASPAPPQLAMAYTLGLVLPSGQVRPLMESHQEACERAGAGQCQVLGAEAKSEGKNRDSATLTLRAMPAWMRMFRTRAEADAKDMGGRLADAGTEGEDLTRNIADTEAAQRARAAEQQRLAELMHRHTRHLDQAVQVEQQITQVQGDIDKSASDLAAMQNRVAMQTVTVTYQSTALVAPDGLTAPLAEAGKDFTGHVVNMLAMLVTLVSFLLPFGLVGVPIAWWINKQRKAKPVVAPPAA